MSNVLSIFSTSKEDLNGLLASFKEGIAETNHLKTVLTDEWFAELKELIDNYDGKAPFDTKTHTLFIDYCHGLWRNKNFVQELDYYYEVISDKIKNHRIKSLKSKLRRFTAKDYPNYLGTVYEIIVVGKFAEKGNLKEYEPILPGTKYRPEAEVDISGQEILIEATVRVSNRNVSLTSSFGVGAGSREAKHQLDHKMKVKIDKLENIKVPIILFVNNDPTVVFPEVGIPEVMNWVKVEPTFTYVSAVIISHFHNEPDGGDIYINQACKNPLNCESIAEIKKIFKLANETILA